MCKSSCYENDYKCYKDFKCIADKCRHSCCVGWDISVDGDTLEKYNDLNRDDILCHINDGEITLGADGRCPFLCTDGLCRLISKLGDSYTSVICREHPRFYHRVGDLIEGGIGASCEEAARIILSSDSYAEFFASDRQGEPADETDFDTIPYRDEIYSVLKSGLSFREKLSRISKSYGVSVDIHRDEEWKEIFSELEYLDEGDRESFSVGEIDERAEMHPYFERFFAYLVFRHLTVAESYENMRARLGFCLLLTSVLENLSAKRSVDFSEICNLVRIISEEIEYSEENTSSLIFEFECAIN
ncbi:MAG: flagellin lysine-N-methylase [Clostridia bacterium]|nr:flagellin lysine-N-methylase [Clostridia bacterium]